MSLIQVWLHGENAGFGVIDTESTLYDAWRKLIPPENPHFLARIVTSKSVRDTCQLYWRQAAVVAETGTNSYLLPNRQFDLHKIPPLCDAITDGQHQLNHLIERRYEHPVDKGTVSNNASGSYKVVLGGIIVYPVFVIVLPFRGEQASVSDNCEVGHITDSVHQSETLEVHNIRYLIQVSAPSLDWSWTFLTSSVEASSSKLHSEVLAVLMDGLTLAGQEYITRFCATYRQDMLLHGSSAPSSIPQAPRLNFRESDIRNDSTSEILAVSNALIYKYKEKYAAKILNKEHLAYREVALMEFAKGYSVEPLGLVRFDDPDVVCGYMMPLERPLETVAEDSTIDDATKMGWLHEILALLRGIHARGVIHGDVNMNNLLLCSDGRIRLCDFGNAALLTEDWYPRSYTDRYCSTYRMKPFGHVTQDTLKLKKEEDIFALGVIGWELFSGREAYSDLDSDEFYDWVVKEGKGLDLEEISNLEAREFISRCFEETEEELALPPVEE